MYNTGDKLYVAIACGWDEFLHKKVISSFFFFDVAPVCLLQPRCRFLINIVTDARGSAEVHVLLFYGHMIKRSFHTCSL